jgi:hypothetical protein
LSVSAISFTGMTAELPIVVEAERLVQRLSDALTRPRAGECLCCYVARMLDEFPCDGTHRHALRYRDATAPRATALSSRLRSVGACCCDCEVFLNGYQPRSPARGYFGEDDLDDEYDDCDDDPGDAVPLTAVLPTCEGVRRGSVRPCAAWMRIRR